MPNRSNQRPTQNQRYIYNSNRKKLAFVHMITVRNRFKKKYNWLLCSQNERKTFKKKETESKILESFFFHFKKWIKLASKWWWKNGGNGKIRSTIYLIRVVVNMHSGNYTLIESQCGSLQIVQNHGKTNEMDIKLIY